MGRREEPNWLLSVKGAGQGEAHVWEQEETWLFHSARNCSEYPRSNLAWPRGWTFLLTSQKPERKDEDRHFFSLIMRKNDTQEAFQTFLQYGLSFKSGEREMNAENSGCATKKMCIPKQNPKLKRHYKMNFICTKLIKCSICLQSSEITGHTFQNDYWTEKSWDPNLRSPLKFLNLGSKNKQPSAQW